MANIAIGRTKRLNGRMVKWNGKRWVPTTKAKPKPKAKPTPKVKDQRYKAPSVPKKKDSPKPKPKAKAKPTAAKIKADAAGKRALRRTALRTGVKGGVVGLGMAGIEYAGRTGRLGDKIKTGFDEKDQQVEQLLKHGPLSDKAYKTNKSKPQSKPANKTGNSVTGQANYTKQQQRMSDARSNPRYKKKDKVVPAGKVPDTKKPTTKKPTTKAPVTKAPTPKAPSPKGNRMASSSSADRMAAWAKANRKMIEKSGTKKQKELLAKALKVTTPKKKTSSSNAAGWQGNRNY